VAGDSFSGGLSRAAGSALGTYPINLNNLSISTPGATASNYTITYNGALFTIKQMPITVKADAQTKNYGASDPALTSSIISGALASGDSLKGSLVRQAGNNVGVYAINQGTLAASSNYVLTYQSANFTITAKPLTVTALPNSKAVGAPDPVLNYSFSPALITGDSFTGALSRDPGETAGNYAIRIGTLTVGPGSNYAIAFNSAIFSIVSLKSQSITFAPLGSKPLGTAPFTLTATASSGLAVTFGSSDPLVASVSGNTVTLHKVGFTTITASQGGNATYAAATPVPQLLTVTAVQPCTTALVWLPPISLGKVQQGGSVLPIKFFVEQCCGKTDARVHDDNGDDDGGDDDGSEDNQHSGHGDDYRGGNVACRHGNDGRSSNNQNCHHDCDHDDDDNGCANLRDKTVVISIYELGSHTPPATQYKYGTGSPNPPDYAIDGDYKYQLNFPTAKGTHHYHIDVYRVPAGSSTPVLVGWKEFSTK
jgi:hypothetical protein